MRDHFKEYIWEHNVYRDLGPSMDDHRAYALVGWRPCHWDEAAVGAWLEERWDAWVAAPPPWFTPQWVEATIPERLLPAAARGGRDIV